MEEERKQQAGNSINKYKNLSKNINKVGKGMNKVGDFMSKSNSAGLQNFGSKLSNTGSNLQNFSSKMNTPFQSASSLGSTGATTGATVGETAGTLGSAGATTGTMAGAEGGALASGAGTAGASSAVGAGASTGAGASGAMGATPIGAIVMAIKSIYDKNTKKMHKNEEKILEQGQKDLQTYDDTGAKALEIANGEQNTEEQQDPTQPQPTELLGQDQTNIPTEQLTDLNGQSETANNENIIGNILGKFKGGNDGQFMGASADISQSELPTDIQQVQPPENYPRDLGQFQQSLKDVGWDEQTITNAMNGLNSGNKEMADYINSYNQYANDGQQIRLPQTPEEIALARQGLFNTPQETNQGNATQTDDQRSIIQKIMSGANDFSKGFKENRDTKFSADNLKADPTKDKMQRTGEAIGSLYRMLGNPAVQGLVATGLSKAQGNGIVDSILTGYKQAQNRSKSNYYQDLLNKYSDSNRPYNPFETYTNDDYKNQADVALKEALNKFNMNLNQDKFDETVRKNDAYIENLANNYKLNQEKVEIARQNANNNSRRTDAYIRNSEDQIKNRNKKIGEKLEQLASKSEMGKRLSYYYQALEHNKQHPEDGYDINAMTADFIKDFNQDPQKLIYNMKQYNEKEDDFNIMNWLNDDD